MARPRSGIVLVASAVLSLLLLVPTAGLTQGDSPPVAPGPATTGEALPTLEQIETARKEAEASTTLDEATNLGGCVLSPIALAPMPGGSVGIRAITS